MFKTTPGKRAIQLPKFNMPYESGEDAQMRLQQSIVMHEGRSIYIHQVGGRKPKYTANVYNSEKAVSSVMVADLDLRSPEPGYITLNNQVGYLTRFPARQQKQGLFRGNYSIFTVGSQVRIAAEVWDLMKGLDNRDNLLYNENLMEIINHGLVNGIRLSNSVALYQEKGVTKVEYRGRYLGDIVNGRVALSEKADQNCSWLLAHLGQVDLAVGG